MTVYMCCVRLLTFARPSRFLGLAPKAKPIASSLALLVCIRRTCCRPRPRPMSDFHRSIMERVNVRCLGEEEKMSIAFLYAGKQSCLQRDKNEHLEKALTRVRASAIKKSKVVNKRSKSKKMKQDLEHEEMSPIIEGNQLCEDMCVSLVHISGDVVDRSISNDEAWQNGAVLKIGSSLYCVYRNAPVVTEMSLPRCVIVGCPVFPRIALQFADDSLTKYVWYKGLVPHSNTTCNNKKDPKKRSSDEDVSSEKCENGDNLCLPPSSSNPESVRQWLEVSNEKIYTPTSEDEGCLLKLVCMPRLGEACGLPSDCTLQSEVKSFSNNKFPFEKRHKFTTKMTSEESFRMVSYNILANMYADSEFSRDVLYSYCRPEFLNIDYREQVLLKEITGYNADVICLQEAGKKLFENSLVPSMQLMGLAGIMCCKHGGLSEGEAVFYRSSKFRLVRSHDISLCEALETGPIYTDLLATVSKNDAMLHRVITRAAVVQVVVLEEIANPSRKLCVANTHLYFHPRAGHVRLIQIAVIIRHLEHLKMLYKEQHGVEDLAVIFCGDLNSTPGTSAYELLLTGSVPKNTVDWYSSGKHEFCGGMALTHGLKLNTAFSKMTYTNYVAGYHGVLDHVFFEPQYLSVEQQVPMPSHEDVIQHTALPNEVFPSDHLALICDLRWKTR